MENHTPKTTWNTKLKELDWLEKRPNLVDNSSFFSHGLYDWFLLALSQAFITHAHENKKSIYEKQINGYFDNENLTTIQDYLNQKYIDLYSSSAAEAENSTFVDNESLIRFSIETESFLRINIISTRKDSVSEITNYFLKFLTKRPRDNKGNAFVLASDYEGITTRKLGFAAVDIEESNYNKEVQEAIKFIINDLKSPVPTGKLVIIEGMPGTGKTFLLRGLISEISNAYFIIIPPSMIQKLADPSIIPTLLNLKEYSDVEEKDSFPNSSEQKNKKQTNPVVLVVEDADECLMKRDTGNMPSISSILNLTSGILGDLLDIRIIATTNAKKTDMDEAVIRDGRLSCHVEIGKVLPEQATKIYRRLTKNEEAEYPHGDEAVLLASIYKLAKEKNGEGTKKELKSFAFSVKSRNLTKNRIGF